VDCILLTHGHLDHAGGADGLRNELVRLQGGTVPIIGPDERDAFLLSDIAAQAARAQADGHGQCDGGSLCDRWRKPAGIGAVDAVLHVPGHTPGHVVFHDPKALVLPLWGIPCFAVRSGALIFLMAMVRNSFRPSWTVCCRWATR
jgi:glyoxylase-like metal-dependent hydrolase (beta-lactamase superfamily II)